EKDKDKPIQAVIFTTKEGINDNWYKEGDTSNKEKLKYLLENEMRKDNNKCKPVLIEKGTSSEELWKNFNIILKELSDDDEIYIDVTNSFRSIPIIFMSILEYARVIKKNLKVKGIFYGEFDSDKKETNIIDLSAFITFQEWAKASEQFLVTGNSMLLSKKIQDISQIDGEEEERKIITSVSNKLEKYSQDLLICRGKDLTNDVKELVNNLKVMKEIKNTEYEPFKKILDTILKDLSNYTGEPVNDALYAVEKCRQYGLLQQAYTMMQEVFITYLTNRLNTRESENYKSRSQRKKIEKIKGFYIDEKKKGNIDLKDNEKKLIEELGEDYIKRYFEQYSRLGKYRNNIDHAQFTNTVVEIENLKNELLTFIQEFKNLIRLEYYDEAAITENNENTNCLVMLSHNLQKEQIDELKNNFNVNKIIYLSENLMKSWRNINPKEDINEDLFNEFNDEILNKTSEGDYVIVQGEWGITYAIVSSCLKLNRIPIYATTERKVLEEENSEGKVQSKKIFKHVKFREYKNFF
ncbi:MAG: TIGR02221 family CRISPR-associated protein, partial [Clostridium sp.]|nr:TIGR02221 family CRISPR-associated protein [Clostridium sp.]